MRQTFSADSPARYRVLRRNIIPSIGSWRLERKSRSVAAAYAAVPAGIYGGDDFDQAGVILTVMDGYEKVMAIATNHPEWLEAIQACYAYPADYFAGKWILSGLSVRPAPTLQPLIRFGILMKDQESSDGGHKGWYRFIDREGVGRALVELGQLAA